MAVVPATATGCASDLGLSARRCLTAWRRWKAPKEGLSACRGSGVAACAATTAATAFPLTAMAVLRKSRRGSGASKQKWGRSVSLGAEQSSRTMRSLVEEHHGCTAIDGHLAVVAVMMRAA